MRQMQCVSNAYMYMSRCMPQAYTAVGTCIFVTPSKPPGTHKGMLVGHLKAGLSWFVLRTMIV